MEERNREALTQKSLELQFNLSNTDYRPIETIGSGAYGVVCSAFDERTKTKVAIKKIPAIFDHSSIEVAKRTAREIKILRHFRHQNIVGVQDILQPNTMDVYIVLDLMETDLHHIIYSKQVLTAEHVRFFLYQLLRGLKFIHSANVIHRDLKPSNILINEDCHLKIGDFGMARGIASTPASSSLKLTHYVATRWYRAPEIMLMMDSYNTAVDVWSVGCIMAEMIQRKHLFPGKNFMEQLSMIMSAVGRPSNNLVNRWKLRDVIKNCLQTASVLGVQPLSDVVPLATGSALTLLEQLLTFDPEGRPSAEEALASDYLQQYRCPQDEPICGQKLDWAFEMQLQTREGLKAAIQKEVDYYRQRYKPVSFQFTPVPSNQNVSRSEPITFHFTPVAANEKQPNCDAKTSQFPTVIFNDSTLQHSSDKLNFTPAPSAQSTSKDSKPVMAAAQPQENTAAPNSAMDFSWIPDQSAHETLVGSRLLSASAFAGDDSSNESSTFAPPHLTFASHTLTVQAPVTPAEVEMLSAKLQESLDIKKPSVDPGLQQNLSTKERLKQVSNAAH